MAEASTNLKSET